MQWMFGQQWLPGRVITSFRTLAPEPNKYGDYVNVRTKLAGLLAVTVGGAADDVFGG